jgi:hypothetical protein
VDDHAPFMAFVQAIARGDRPRVSRLLADQPGLASARAQVGATRQTAAEYFLGEIDHYIYAGDTALHIAAAAYQQASRASWSTPALSSWPRIDAARSHSTMPSTVPQAQRDGTRSLNRMPH